MKYYTLYEFVFPLCFLLVAAWLLTMGVRGLIKKQASIYSGRLSFALTALFMLPFFILGWNMVLFGPRNGGPDLNEFAIISIPLLLLLFWRKMKGLTVVGITPEKLRQILAESKANLEVRNEPWKWFGFVGFATALRRDAESESAQQLGEMLNSSDIALERGAFVLQLGLGLALSVAALAIRYLA